MQKTTLLPSPSIFIRSIARRPPGGLQERQTYWWETSGEDTPTGERHQERTHHLIDWRGIPTNNNQIIRDCSWITSSNRGDYRLQIKTTPNQHHIQQMKKTPEKIKRKQWPCSIFNFYLNVSNILNKKDSQNKKVSQHKNIQTIVKGKSFPTKRKVSQYIK